MCVGEGQAGDVPFEQLVAHEAPRSLRATAIDLAALIYTSGSTGKPKGVTLTHRNMTFAAASIVEYLEMQQDEVVLLCLPLSFDYGLYQLLLAIMVGGTLVLEKGFAFPGKVVQLLESEDITGLPGVPTLFGVLLGLRGLEARELPALRYLTNTGAALSVTTIAGLRETFPKARIYSMYGLTECKRVSYLPPDQIDVKPASVGIAIPGTEVWVEDDDGNECAPGEVGELIVRGPHVMQGYWNDPEATAKRLRPGRWPWERVLMTGDLFRATTRATSTSSGARTTSSSRAARRSRRARSRKSSTPSRACATRPWSACRTSCSARRSTPTSRSSRTRSSTSARSSAPAPPSSRTTWSRSASRSATSCRAPRPARSTSSRSAPRPTSASPPRPPDRRARTTAEAA